jgi:hypothetical protein
MNLLWGGRRDIPSILSAMEQADITNMCNACEDEINGSKAHPYC